MELRLRPYQREAIDAVFDHFGRYQSTMLVQATGCHVAGQEILLHDGSLKRVEDVEIGDAIMGWDSTPRYVLSLCRGEDEIVEVKPIKGQSWYVNKDHILTLMKTQQSSAPTCESRKGGRIVDVPIPTWQRWAGNSRHIYKLFRAGVTFAQQAPLPLDPYFLGLVLGDGSLDRTVNVCKSDLEVRLACETIAEEFGLHVRTADKERVPTHFLVGRAGVINPLNSIMRSLKLWGLPSEQKFIPLIYKTASRNERLACLAGLLDSDGSLSCGGYDYISKSERLAQDVSFLARSLGLAAYVRPCEKYCQTGAGGTYWRVFISGDCSTIPCRIPRKQASPRQQKKSVLRTGFNIVPTGERQPYYGFTLTGDGRYLLDDFTVTHNTGKSAAAACIAARFRPQGRVLFLADQKELLFQMERTIQQWTDLKTGVEQAEKTTAGLLQPPDVTIASVQSLSSPSRLARFPRDAFGLTIVDECDRSIAPTFRAIFDYFPSQRLGMSIGPESVIELRGGCFGLGWVGTIAAAWQAIGEAGARSGHRFGYDYISVSEFGIESRGWNGERFTWKPVQTFVRHACDKPTVGVNVAGVKTVLTDDHSVYRAKSGASVVIDSHGNTKKIAVLQEQPSSDLSTGDIIPVDDGKGWEEGQTLPAPIAIIDLLQHRKTKAKILVAVDTSSLSLETWKSAGVDSRHRYAYKRGKYGGVLPLALYKQLRKHLPPPVFFYYEGAMASVEPLVRLSDWAYVLGYWLGNGWVDDQSGRVGFSVKKALVEEFTQRLSALPYVKWNIKCSDKGTGCTEIKASNVFVAEILRSIFGKVSAQSKFIPGEWIIAWPEKARRALLHGLIDSDGHLNQQDRNRNRYIYTTTSKRLANDILSLLRSLGVMGYVYIGNPALGGIVDGRQIIGRSCAYRVHWSASALAGNHGGKYGHCQRLAHGDLSFHEGVVRNLCSVEPPQFVYDLEMEGHPSFVANGLLVHNTATPFRADGRAMGVFYESVAYVYEIRDAIEGGYLCPIKQQRVEVQSLDLSRLRTTGKGDFDDEDLATLMMEERPLHEVAQPTVELSGNRPTLVFATTIAHAKALAEVINRYKDKSAVAIDGSADDITRERVLSAFRTGKIQYLVNCALLSRGVDIPIVSCIAMARPTKSRSLYVQCLDEKTEILTKRGFLGPDEIASDDEIAAFDLKTETVTWANIISRVDRPLADGEEMYSLQTPGLDLRVTGGHRLVYRTRDGRKKIRSPWKFATAEELASRTYEYEIPLAGHQDAPGVPLTDSELSFLGWFITDGTHNKANGQIALTQAEGQPESHHRSIREALEGCGFTYGVYRSDGQSNYTRNSAMLVYTISRGQPRGRDSHLTGWERLEAYIDKDFSPLLDDMTNGQLAVFLEAVHLGDGHKNKGQSWTQRSYHIVKGNKVFLERLQSLCVRRGWKANLHTERRELPFRDSYVLHVKPQRPVRAVGGSLAMDRAHLQRTVVIPGERVWCVENEYGTIVTRRNGKVAIVGNCAGRGTRLSPGKKDLILLDFVNNSGRHSLVTAFDILDGNMDVEVKERAESLCQQDPELGVLEAMEQAEAELAEERRREELKKRQQLIAKAVYQATEIDPFAVLGVHLREGRWGGAPITEEQKMRLTKHKIPWQGLDKGQAEQTIKKIAERARKGLCTIPMARNLAKHGINPDLPFDLAHEIMGMLAEAQWRPSPDLLQRIRSMAA